MLVNLSHEAEQQGTGSIDAGTEWGKTFLEYSIWKTHLVKGPVWLEQITPD
ncbi:hypothetical protein THF1D04_270043 [Vibrio owensii]|uniref:Uncharacterized protein n=1 Tax=Vibrio owensii TaxID=696485 RepID=A0AAU9Q5T5_9VIBR|nr:hypothetical protein THF1D04_270043 [Vibrio owensii]